MKQTGPRFARKYYFIDRSFQGKYILLTVLLLLTYSLIFAAVLFAPYIQPLYFDYPLPEQTEAARSLLLLHDKVWPALGAVILIMGGLSIFVTHKIAGPIYRFKTALAEIAKGNFNTRITLRKWDDLQDVAGHINLLSEELCNFVTQLKNDYELLSGYINELEREIAQNLISEEAGRETIRNVQAARQNIEASLNRFTSAPSEAFRAAPQLARPPS